MDPVKTPAQIREFLTAWVNVLPVPIIIRPVIAAFIPQIEDAKLTEGYNFLRECIEALRETERGRSILDKFGIND